MVFLLRKFLKKKKKKRKLLKIKDFMKKTYILNYYIVTMNNTFFV